MRLINAVLLFSLLLLLSCSDSSISPAVPIATFSVSDADDVSLQPDFKQIDIFIYEDFQRIDLTLWNDSSPFDEGNFIYLYGTHRDLIYFDSASYNIRRDPGADGHFEVLVAEGEVRWANSKKIVFIFANEIFPDIGEKDVWVYSIPSKDRLPDTGRIQVRMPD